MVIPVKHCALPPHYTHEVRRKRLARMKAKCVLTESGCWEYRTSHNAFGYVQLCIGKTKWMAHRLTYALARGDLPPNLYVCHTCDNRCCINPDHMFLGDHLANQQDKHRKGRCPQRAKTQCKQGHPYSEENTYITPLGHRGCKTCARIKCRIAGGWTREQAENMPVTPFGYRPVNGKFKKRSETEEGSP